MIKHKWEEEERQYYQNYSHHLAERCRAEFGGLLGELNRKIDRRLVKTFMGLLLVIGMHRHRNQGLLLSELGGYLLGHRRAVAGSKRISKLLQSKKWKAGLISRYLWRRAKERVDELAEQGEEALIIWDESVIEKPESLSAERLCAVRSSKAQRLKRIKPGYFNPPGGRPVFVPGFNWLQVLVMGKNGPPQLAAMRWWTTRGDKKRTKRQIEAKMLRKTAASWGSRVLHIFDRGFAGRPWLTLLFVHAVEFVLRWPKNYQLMDEQGNLRKAWEINRGKRSWEKRAVWDARRRCYRKVGIIAYPVKDPAFQQDLWLVVARPGQGKTPWYLLTSKPVLTPQQAWPIVFAYARRWQVEMAIRFHKSALAFESPRLISWQARKKLLMITSLVYAFLLTLLRPDPLNLKQWLLDHFCPRHGKWQEKVLLPLYRLRLALSLLWAQYSPIPLLRLN